MARAQASGTIKCPHCRQPLPEGSRFCLSCGRPVGSPATAAAHEPESKRPQRPRGHWPLTLALLAMLIGGLALAAYGLVAATGEGGGQTPGQRPLARAGIGADGHELPPEAGNATTDAITLPDETEPGSGGSDETDDGGGPHDGNPPATGIASPDQALAAAFGLAEGETVVPCSAADPGDTLCYLTYLTNVKQGRYLYQVGLPFSEPFAWALVEQQGDGTFETTQTADFDFEGDGTLPFSPTGAMAGLTFTSELLDDHPTDRLDDGSSPLPAGATEVYLFVRYTGLQPSDDATVTLDGDGSSLGDPAAIEIEPSGEGWVTFRIAGHDGAQLSAGTYTAAVLLNRAVIARASLVVADPTSDAGLGIYDEQSAIKFVRLVE